MKKIIKREKDTRFLIFFFLGIACSIYSAFSFGFDFITNSPGFKDFNYWFRWASLGMFFIYPILSEIAELVIKIVSGTQSDLASNSVTDITYYFFGGVFGCAILTVIAIIGGLLYLIYLGISDLGSYFLELFLK